jgi:DHA1 family bicyclomycin/chloramphenicol resistance-like MFS transporter
VSRPNFRLFALLAACAVLGPLQLNVYLPSLPLVQREFGASVAQVQWTVSLAMAAFGVGLLLFGPLSDRYGRRPVLIAGIAVFGAASAVAAIAPGLTVLAVARMVQSIGASIVFITTRAVVADLTPRDQLQRSVAQLTMIMLMGQMVAPLIGNAVMSVGGWRTIQYVLAAAGLALTALTSSRLEETLKVTSVAPPSQLLRPALELLTRPRFKLQLLQIGLLYSAYPAFVSIAPHLMVDVFHRPATDYAWYFALLPLGYFSGNAIVLRFGSRITGSGFIRGGALWAGGAALLALALLAGGLWHPLALFVPAGLLLNLGLGLALPSATARAISQSWPNTASGWGLAGFLQQLTGACAVQVLGFFPSATPYPVLGLCALLAAIPALIERWLRKAVNPQPDPGA